MNNPYAIQVAPRPPRWLAGAPQQLVPMAAQLQQQLVTGGAHDTSKVPLVRGTPTHRCCAPLQPGQGAAYRHTSKAGSRCPTEGIITFFCGSKACRAQYAGLSDEHKYFLHSAAHSARPIRAAPAPEARAGCSQTLDKL